MYAKGWRDAFVVATTAMKGRDATYEKAERNPKMGICIPKGMLTGQLQDVLLKYLRDHPEKRHNSTPFFAFWAVRKAWPCR